MLYAPKSSATRRGRRSSQAPVDLLPTCCGEQADVRALWLHLAEEYPEVVRERIADELVRAKQAVELFGGSPDGVRTVALLTRAQLDLLTGRCESEGRIAPQSHPPRRRSES